MDRVGGRSSAHVILRNFGFKNKRTLDGRKFLMERFDIVLAHVQNSYARCTLEDLDETWVNENHSKKFLLRK